MPDNDNSAQKGQSSERPEEVTTQQSLVQSMLEAWDGEAIGVSTEIDRTVKDIIEYLGRQLHTVKIDRPHINGLIEALDKKIGTQLDEILHNEQFQRLESSWTGLKWMVDRTNFEENILVDLISTSKKELMDDFEDCSNDVTISGLYNHVYRSQYGMAGGKPYGAMIVNYEFNHLPPDMKLLSQMAEVAAMAHAPIVSAASPELFGPKGFKHFDDPKYSIQETFAGREYAKWNSFREDENAAYVGLTVPHFLLRLPYSEKSNPIDDKEFKYNERIGGKHGNYLWGNSAFAFASRLTDSFRQWRWCLRIVGEQSGGAIRDLNVHTIEENGEMVQKPPTELALPFDREFQLAQAGLIGLVWTKEKDQCVIYGAAALRKPRKYSETEEGNKKTANDSLRSMFPCMFIATRFAHYLKRIQTSFIGDTLTARDVQKELNKWIMQYVNAVPDPQSGTLGKQPLAAASVVVEQDPRAPGVLLSHIKLVPHVPLVGITTTLELVSRQSMSKEQ